MELFTHHAGNASLSYEYIVLNVSRDGGLWELLFRPRHRSGATGMKKRVAFTAQLLERIRQIAPPADGDRA